MKKLILAVLLILPGVSFADYYLQAGGVLKLRDGSRVYCEQEQRQQLYRYSCVCTLSGSNYFQHGVIVTSENPRAPGLGAVLAACKELPFYQFQTPAANVNDCRRD